jgi:hypothetical protein
MIVCTVPLVSIDAQVISRTNEALVSDLTHDELVISENEDPQILAYFRRLRAPLSLVIVLNSASADRNASSLSSNVSALGLASALEPGDEVSVLDARGPQILQSYTADSDLIIAAIERAYLQSSASVAPAARRLRLALERAAEQAQMAHNPEAHRAIILISDVIQTDRDEVLPLGVLAAIVRSRSALCLAGLEGLAPQSVGDTQDLNKVTISAMVSLTGGSLVDDDWKSSLERMRSIYRIAYFADDRRSGELVRIKLDLKPDAKRRERDFALTYPRLAISPDE